jgi:LPXTG-motif cell wall-anchored protein
MYINQQITLLPEELKEVQRYGFYWKGSEVFLADWYWNSASTEVQNDYKKRAMNIYILNPTTGIIIQTIKGSLIGGIQTWMQQTAKTQIENVQQGVEAYIRQQTSMPKTTTPPIISIPETGISKSVLYFAGALVVLGALLFLQKKKV